jgi:hypothetical protein
MHTTHIGLVLHSVHFTSSLLIAGLYTVYITFGNPAEQDSVSQIRSAVLQYLATKQQYLNCAGAFGDSHAVLQCYPPGETPEVLTSAEFRHMTLGYVRAGRDDPRLLDIRTVPNAAYASWPDMLERLWNGVHVPG